MSDDDPKNPHERREDPRHFACFPAHIQRPGGSIRMALIRDLSVTGALILTRERPAVGDDIRLSLYLTDDMEDPRVAEGKVVRVETRTAERAEVWHQSVAVQFHEPLHDREAEIHALAAHQAKLGLPRD
jgi:hypothetical protein